MLKTDRVGNDEPLTRLGAGSKKLGEMPHIAVAEDVHMAMFTVRSCLFRKLQGKPAPVIAQPCLAGGAVAWTPSLNRTTQHWYTAALLESPSPPDHELVGLQHSAG